MIINEHATLRNLVSLLPIHGISQVEVTISGEMTCLMDLQAL